MAAGFRLNALNSNYFQPLFAKDDRALKVLDIKRMVVDVSNSYPCRVSLVDAKIGETVLLLPYTHHDVQTPYKASGPIFVRDHAQTAILGENEVPELLWRRLLSLRAYDLEGMMVNASVGEGRDLASDITALLDDEQVSYLQIHNARQGCFHCSVGRV